MTADRRRPRRAPSASAAAADGAPGDGATGVAVGAIDPARLADHAAIDRLADELVPALIAKLAASGLGEIEIGEGDWTIRVRRPADGSTSRNRRSTDRGSRSQPGHAGHGHGPAAFEGHRTTRDLRPGSAGGAPGNGASPAGAAADGAPAAGSGDRMGSHRAVATSPAVGVYQPRNEARPGTRVRAGDRIGAVDLLGVPQDVVAPADGIVGASLAEAGEAVEYGQELVVIELAAARPSERSEA